MNDARAARGLVPVPAEFESELAPWADALNAAAAGSARALYLHGSALGPSFDPATSDFNLLLVLAELPQRTLEALARTFADRAKAGARRVTPLVLTERQIRDSNDVFPVEFRDLVARRALLSGEDVLADLYIAPKNLRHQCESELRSKLVGLRQAYLLRGGAPGSARDLLVRSAGGSAAVMRGLLELRGAEVPDDANSLVDAVAREYRVQAKALASPFAARMLGNTLDEDSARTLLATYIEALETLIRAVDALVVE